MADQLLVIDGQTPQLLQVAAQGPPGPPGIPGSGGDLHLEFTQAVPASVWTIAHNLGKYPSVAVVDSARNWVIGDVDYIDTNTLTITFSGAFSGTCYLN